MIKASQKYIHPSSFMLLENWSVQYLLESSFSYNEKYSLARISNFLTRNKTAIYIDNDKWYKRVTIKIKNGGIFIRDTEIGKKIGTKKQFLVKKGQFLLSKIDARNGAFGVVPEELDGAIITGNFWTFDVDYSKINPHFLSLITTTSEFLRFSENASNGTTNRHYLQEDLFLKVKIPLPSIEEQNRILENFNGRSMQAAQIEQAADEKDSEITEFFFKELGVEKKNLGVTSAGLDFISYKEIERWALSHLLKKRLFLFQNAKYPIRQIKTLLTFFEGGKTPSTTRTEFWNGDVYWASAKDMKELYLENIQDRITNIAVQEGGMKIYPEGTILGVFRSGILRHSFPVAITKVKTAINQDLKAMGVNEEYILPVYFLFYLNVFQEMILERAQKIGVTVESINTEEFAEIPVILPPKEIQRSIAEVVSLMKKDVEYKRQQSETLRYHAIQEFENEIFKPCN